MSKQKLMSMKKKTILGYVFILIVFMFLTMEVECIKFGRKDVPKVQQPQHNKEKEVAEKISDKKVGEGKVNDGGQIDNSKLKSSEGKDSVKIKQEKTPDNKKTQQTPQKTTTKVQVQQKPKPSKSWFHAVDSLFGGDDSPAKSKPQSKPLTITPETTTLSRESKPSTVPQSHPITQQAQPKSNILGELFGSNIQKNVQETKKQQPKVQDQKKEIPTTTVIQPEKKGEKKSQNVKEQSKVKIESVKQQKEKTETKNQQKVKIQSKKQQDTKQKQSLKPDNNKKEQKSDEKKDDKKQKQLKDQNKNKNEDEDEQESQDDEVIYPKNTKPQKKNKKVAAQPHKQGQLKYTFTLLLTFLLYTFIIVMVIITIKCTSQSSKAAKAVNIMVDAVGDAFKKRQGYRPTLNEEEITEREDQITVGYNVDDNKQIFWEKNSVEGI